MSKVTSKLQVTIPKAIAERYNIAPGQEIEWLPAGDAIRVVASKASARETDVARRLAIFDEATARQRERERNRPVPRQANGRGWTREELYERGSAR